uniref:Uncharacterized protein n=1 Tax=Isometrus maculatus TaxID=497827 RepID=A0A0U1S877_ISOMC|nr:hypothetical protein [Isometrus maculatus]
MDRKGLLMLFFLLLITAEFVNMKHPKHHKGRRFLENSEEELEEMRRDISEAKAKLLNQSRKTHGNIV